MPNNHGADDISAERAKLGTDDNRPTAFGKMETNSKIFRIVLVANGCGEVDTTETGVSNGLE